MRIALGMIIRDVDSEEKVLRFAENAEKYGHRLDCAIIAHTRAFSPLIAEKIRKKSQLFTVDINNPSYCREQLKKLGVSGASISALLDCPVDTDLGLVPYGYKRTLVAVEAMLRGVDVLFFADDDVYPSALTVTDGGPVLEDADFFGAHLRQLAAGSLITTGEYSGYNILPPASFDGMEDLLLGLQKGDMLDFWKSSGTHKCLAVKPAVHTIAPCTKILGGNTAVTLSAFDTLPPFFSSYHIVRDELYLNRGEDTVLGVGIAENGIPCADIGLYPMHDTYKDYPKEPDLRNDPSAQERFFFACTGWVGRNPFYNYIRGNDDKNVREFQRGHLKKGLDSLTEYTANPRFKTVLDNFEESWNNLNRYIGEYERVLEAWEEFKEKRRRSLT